VPQRLYHFGNSSCSVDSSFTGLAIVVAAPPSKSQKKQTFLFQNQWKQFTTGGTLQAAPSIFNVFCNRLTSCISNKHNLLKNQPLGWLILP
jgi:hypothetical protein